MRFVDIGVAKINPLDVSSLEWSHRTYVNAGPESTLIITMRNGAIYRIRNDSLIQWPGSVYDIYEIEKRILEAQS